jgi:hypothetical protein
MTESRGIENYYRFGKLDESAEKLEAACGEPFLGASHTAFWFDPSQPGQTPP